MGIWATVSRIHSMVFRHLSSPFPSAIAYERQKVTVAGQTYRAPTG